MSWLGLLGLYGGFAVGWCISELWAKLEAKRNTKAIERQREKWAQEDAVDYCFGCDEIKPRAEMAFVDEDGDGIPDALYRCRQCRGVVTPLESQQDCNERMAEHWRVTPARCVEIADDGGPPRHAGDCQCSRCKPYVIPWEPMTPEQIENVRNRTAAQIAMYRAAGVAATARSNEAYERGIVARRERMRRNRTRSTNARRPQHH